MEFTIAGDSILWKDFKAHIHHLVNEKYHFQNKQIEDNFMVFNVEQKIKPTKTLKKAEIKFLKWLVHSCVHAILKYRKSVKNAIDINLACFFFVSLARKVLQSNT